jgi:hypothetical protein
VSLRCGYDSRSGYNRSRGISDAAINGADTFTPARIAEKQNYQQFEKRFSHVG